MQVKIEKKDGKVWGESPYLPEFPEAARRLGGKWNGTHWVFDERDFDRVKELYLKFYGEDGFTPVKPVTVRVMCLDDWFSEYRTGLFLFGRMIARGFCRDSGAKLGDDVVLLNGDIDTGGSRKHWYTVARKGSVFEIRGVPLSFMEKKEGVPEALEVSVVEETKGPSREELLKEQQTLMDRINEIDKILKGGV